MHYALCIYLTIPETHPPTPMSRILVLHGPNLELLGRREPEIYGHTTLAEIDARLKELAAADGHELETLQSNAEHVLVERLQQLLDAPVDFLIINPAAFGHTSIALRDVLAATRVPFIEVHLSNIYAREAFRRHSYLSELATGVICGLGAAGYEYAYRAALIKLGA